MYKKAAILCLFVIIFSVCAFGMVCFASSAAEQAVSDKEEESLFVAKKAFEDGFYEVSTGLLERFLKNYPNSSQWAQANLVIGQCLFQQNKFFVQLHHKYLIPHFPF